jgi:hypothetical protein
MLFRARHALSLFDLILVGDWERDREQRRSLLELLAGKSDNATDEAVSRELRLPNVNEPFNTTLVPSNATDISDIQLLKIAASLPQAATNQFQPKVFFFFCAHFYISFSYVGALQF